MAILKFSAIDKKVVIKQLLTAAVNKYSDDQMPGIPPGNCGGVEASMDVLLPPSVSFNCGEHMTLLCSLFQVISTL